MADSGLIARLTLALERSGKKKIDLARACNITPQAVNGWFQSGKIARQHLPKIAATLGTSTDELLNAPSYRASTHTTDAHAVQEVAATYPRANRVPVVGTAQLGDDGYFDELAFPTGNGDGFIAYPTRDPNAYALRVRGDSMRPRIKPGEFVIIEPNASVHPGEEVLVRTIDGRAMVKVLDFRRQGTVQLSSVNEDHKPITIDENQIERLHYVAAIVKAAMYYRDNT